MDDVEILFISDNFPPVIGGSATVYDQVCRHNAASVVALSSRRYFADGQVKQCRDYDRSCGFRIYRVEELRAMRRSWTEGSALARLLGHIVDIGIVLKVCAWIIWLCYRHRIKVICIGELVYLGWIAYLARYVLRIPSVIYCHGEEITQDGSGIFAQSRGAFLRCCSAVIAVSHFCKSEIVSRFEVSADKIRVVTNGVDLDQFRPDAPRPDLVHRYGLEGKKVIVAAGRHVSRKGFDHLLRAMPAILAAHPLAHLLLLGEGPKTDELKEIVAALGIGRHVTFVGFVDSKAVPDHYRLGQVFAMPNRTLADGDQEGFGLVFVEANACGLPVVGGISGGAVEAIEDGITGRLVDGCDIDAIAGAIASILADPEYRSRLVQGGLARARQMGWSTKARQFQRVASFSGARDRRRASEAHNITIAEAKTPARPTLLVTVDLEECFDWGRQPYSNGEVRGLEQLRRFHVNCRELGVQPTYFATYPILRNPEFARVLREAQAAGDCEVGIHMHAWNTPPLYETRNVYNTYQGNLPLHLEEAKLWSFVQTYQEVFGIPPRAHRAGRYGIGRNTHSLLAKYDIRVDSSVSTSFNFSKEGGPNFENDSGAASWVAPNKDVLSLPIGGRRFLKGPLWLSRLSNNDAIDRHFGRAVRLSPEGTQLSWMKMIAEDRLAAGNRDIVVSLHSTSLVEGGNPYARSTKDVDEVLGRLAEFVKWIGKAHNARPITPSRLYSERRAEALPVQA